jgi:hypothetical protein
MVLNTIKGWYDIPSEEKMGWGIEANNKYPGVCKAYRQLLSVEFLLPQLFKPPEVARIGMSLSNNWVVPSPKILEVLGQHLYGEHAVLGRGVLGRSNPIDIYSGLRQGTRDVALTLLGISDFSGVVHNQKMGSFGVGLHDLFHLLAASKVHKETRRLLLNLADLIRSFENEINDAGEKADAREIRDRLIDQTGLPVQMRPGSTPMKDFLNGILEESMEYFILDKWAEDIHRNPEKWRSGDETINQCLYDEVESQRDLGFRLKTVKTSASIYLLLKGLCLEHSPDEASIVCNNFSEHFAQGDSYDGGIISRLIEPIVKLLNWHFHV